MNVCVQGAGEMFQVTTLLPDDASKDVPRTKDGKIATASDFFGKPTFLTVSGQLQVEAYAAALSDVYTFGPTFRAELSHTSRHLAEFWMIEPEISYVAAVPCPASLHIEFDRICLYPFAGLPRWRMTWRWRKIT